MLTRRGLSKLLAAGVSAGLMLALKATRSKGAEDAVISHPQIYPELRVIGRPGVRLPQVTHFGLHYQIFANELQLTFYRGRRWNTPNAEFARDIEQAVRDVLAIASKPE
jgi:hypothetical protein